MKSPRGFGKKYFTLASIQAYSLEPILIAKKSTLSILTFFQISNEDEAENIPSDALLELALLQNSKPCHCNSFFKIKTRIILLINHFIPRCAFYTKYFAFRRTGVHPPLIHS
ncbi:MAG: hypothetical protein WC656_00855 [Sulfurimonas sp.]